MVIILVGEDGKKVGEMELETARKIAKDAGKDLIMVNSKAGIYRIADSGKLKYEQKQKEKEQRANRRTHKVKEIKLKLNTDTHDVEIKTKHIREFLEKGFKTKVTLQLKGREQSFQDVGLEKISSILNMACDGGIGVIDKGPIIEGKNIIAFLNPSK